MRALFSTHCAVIGLDDLKNDETMKDPLTEEHPIVRRGLGRAEEISHTNLRGGCFETDSFPSQLSANERWGYPAQEYDCFMGFRTVRNR